MPKSVSKYPQSAMPDGVGGAFWLCSGFRTPNSHRFSSGRRRRIRRPRRIICTLVLVQSSVIVVVCRHLGTSARSYGNIITHIVTICGLVRAVKCDRGRTANGRRRVPQLWPQGRGLESGLELRTRECGGRTLCSGGINP